MASPFARIIAQLVVASAGIFTRAFVAAYSQAIHNARAGTQETAKTMARKSKVSMQEALQILNLQKSEMKSELILKRYNRYFESKVFRAREALDEQLALLAKQAKEDAAAKAGRTTGGGESGAAKGANAEPKRTYARRTGPRPR